MLNIVRKIGSGLVVLVLLVMPALVSFAPTSAQSSDAPYWPTDGWRTSTPEEQGMDSEKLVAMLDQVVQQEINLHSMLVIRNGYVVLDVSADPYDTSQPHEIGDITKNFLVTVTGIAIDQGYIQSTDQSIWDFFPTDGVANMDPDKESITLAHLLTHGSGLNIAGNTRLTLTADDQSWIQYLLNQPMQAAPGEHPIENEGEPHLLSAILEQTTGMSTAAYTQQVLFDPLGITNTIWPTDPQGVTRGGTGLALSVHDLAKLGYLYLKGGEWDGQQLVPASWLETATSGLILNGQYGYYWWVEEMGLKEPHPSYLAVGYSGQTFVVLPDLDMIVVVTADSELSYNLLPGAFIIPAVKSDAALPPNEAAQEALQAKVDAFANPVPAEVPAPPDLQAQVDGQTFMLADNDLGWTSLTITFGEAEATLALEVQGQRLELPIGLDGVFRVSEAGLPSDISNQRPIADVPLALKGKWSRNRFVITARDLLGTLDGDILLQFADDDTVQVRPQASGLPRTSIAGAPQ
jgi:CubicO group peptidase (beta-lactamase class C family)